MTFTYSITDKEYQEYIKNFYKKTFSKSYLKYLIIVVIIVMFNAYNWTANHVPNEIDNEEKSFLGPLLNWLFLIAIMVGLWYFIFRRLTGAKLIKSQDREVILGERTLTVDTDKVQATTSTAGTTYQWDAIKKWDQTANLYLLYITSNAAIMLPKRVFKSDLEQEKFETLLKTKIQNLTDGKYLDA